MRDARIYIEDILRVWKVISEDIHVLRESMGMIKKEIG